MLNSNKTITNNKKKQIENINNLIWSHVWETLTLLIRIDSSMVITFLDIQLAKYHWV